jgi:hypothetical protein
MKLNEVVVGDALSVYFCLDSTRDLLNSVAEASFSRLITIEEGRKWNIKKGKDDSW